MSFAVDSPAMAVLVATLTALNLEVDSFVFAVRSTP